MLLFGLQDSESDYFNQLVKIGTAGEYTFAAQNGNEHMLSLMDDELNTLKEFVRKGNGPGEMTQIDALTFSEETNFFYIAGGGKLLVLSLDGVIESEEQLGFLNVSDLAYSDGILYIGLMDMMPSQETRDIQSVQIYNLSENTRQFVSVPFDHITVEPANRLDRVPFMRFQTKLTLLNDELYFIVTGNPVVYKLVEEEAVSFYASSGFPEAPFVISYNESMGTYGFRTPSIFNSLSSSEDYLILTNGNQHKHVFVEHSVYVIDSTTATSHLTTTIVDADTSDITCLNASTAHGKLFFYECMFQVSYTVEKSDLNGFVGEL